MNIKEIEKSLQYTYRDKNLLYNALTHNSCRNKTSNERLEFFGDAILEVIIKEYLYINLPNYTEGKLTRICHNIVCYDSLHEVASKLNIERYINTENGLDLTNSVGIRTILANCFEAIVASIWLDSGYKSARHFILNHMSDIIDEAITGKRDKEYKSILQEKFPKENIKYKEQGIEGPLYNKIYIMDLYINDVYTVTGRGTSKKKAQTECARILLDKLAQEEINPSKFLK